MITLYIISLIIYLIVSFRVSEWQNHLLMDNRLAVPALFLRNSNPYHHFATALFILTLCFPLFSSTISLYFIFLNIFLLVIKDYIVRKFAISKFVSSMRKVGIMEKKEKGESVTPEWIKNSDKEWSDIAEQNIIRNIRRKQY